MSGLQWQRHSLWQARLRQGYLSRPGDGLTVRVRTSEDPGGGEAAQAWLTLKAPPPLPAGSALPGEGIPSGGEPELVHTLAAADAAAVPSASGPALSRLEFEYAIPPADAAQMLALTQQQLVKIRHGLDLPGGEWVLDVFEGANAPLVVAEVELQHPDQPVAVPPWCVRELTGRRDLSNAALAARPLALWSAAERHDLLGAA